MKTACILLLLISMCGVVRADDQAVVQASLRDGVKIICHREPSSSLVAVTVFVLTGSAEESNANAGVGNMVADTILTGTTNQTPDTIASSIGSLGGNVKAIWQPDYTQIRALVLPNQYDDAAYLLSDVIKNADFPDSSVETAREDMLSRIQVRTDDVFESTNDRLRATLYDGTPYALPQLGTADTIKRLTSSDLATYFDRNYRPDNTVISIVGNIDPQTAITAFSDDLSDFIRTRIHHVAPLVVPPPLTASDPILVKSFRRDVTAGLMMAGYLAPGVDSADYPSMVVANALLGGMKTSIMFKNLRTKKQYGYEVASTYTAQIGLSDVTGYILYAPVALDVDGKTHIDQTPIVKAALLEQFKELGTTPTTAADLARAKKFVIGSYILSHERIEDRSYYLGYSELAIKSLGGYQFDFNYADAINAVTADDVQRVAQKYFSGTPVISLLLPGDPMAGVEND